MRRFSGVCSVQSKFQLSHKVFGLNIVCPEISRHAKPGQFVQLRLQEADASCIWPRPFSIHKVTGDSVIITIKIYGHVTQEMSLLEPGDSVYMTGPLGNGFPMPTEESPIYLVAGGVGLPPIHFLQEAILEQGYPKRLIHFYSGARTADELLADEEIRASGVHYLVATDDGTKGIPGLITEQVAVELTRRRASGDSPLPLIYACGPTAMLKRMAELSRGSPCYLSLEQLMPCGWGVCNGCAVLISKGNVHPTEDERGFRLARVCKEGPVFEASELVWR